MAEQTSPAIWFDSWYNDGRDNNLDGKIDDVSEKGPKNTDGAHRKGTYKAKIAPVPLVSTDLAPAWSLETIEVIYRVCIDIPIDAYVKAKVPVSKNRWIPNFFKELKRMPGWRVWEGSGRSPIVMDGDIVAAKNAQHQHAGMVKTGWAWDSIINIPGPTSARRYGVFTPSGRNDIVSVPRAVFEGLLGIDVVARWIREK